MGIENVPTGLGSKLERQKETLPVLEVKNKVVWVNPDLDIPFALKVGQPTNLGLFLSRRNNPSETPLPSQKITEMEVESRHNRSALLGRVVFGEKGQGPKQLYRDIDIKGVGFISPLLRVR